MDPTDEHARSVWRSKRWLVAVVLGAVLVTVAWVNSAADSDVSVRLAGAGRTVDRTAASLSTLHTQQQAIAAADEDAFLATWAPEPASQRAGRTMFDNLTALDAHLTLEPVDLDTGLPEIDPDAVWQVEVNAVWRLPGAGTRLARNPLQYDFAPDGSDRVVVSGVSAGRFGLVPIWLGEDLHVRRGHGWTVAAAWPKDARSIARVMPSVLRGVHRLVPQASRRVLLYVPSDVDAMADTVGRVLGGVERVAGLAMSADGSTGRRAPVFVALNPDELALLSGRGRTAVLAHEITHAITGVGVLDMPVWLAEGFADYVGLEVAGVPNNAVVRPVVQDLRAHGLPRAFPDDLAFAGSSRRAVELAYQQSRLAVLAMVERFGAPAVLRMYERVVAHPDDLSGAVRTEFGVGLDEVRRLWRAELNELAGG